MSCAGRSASKARVNALLTRASIFFARSLCEGDGLQVNSGLREFRELKTPQVGQARLAVAR
jgi:hypothetical protein